DDGGPGSAGGDASTGEGDDGDDGGLGADLGTMCPSGSPCGASGVGNTAGSCCGPASSVCGAKCCGAGTICYPGACVTPGKACKSVDDCAEGETCDPSLADDAGGVPACDGGTTSSGAGRCVPRPPTCPPGTDGGVDEAGVACTEACEYHPPTGSFDPVT